MTNPAPPYTGKLLELLPSLTNEALTMRSAWPQERSWVRRALKGGAEVGVRIDQTGRRLVRISRAKTPGDEKAWRAWRAELGTFHHHLGTKDWEPLEERQDVGVSATFGEPVPEPGKPQEPAGPSLQGIVTQLGPEGPTDSSRQPPKAPPDEGADVGAQPQARAGRAANPGAGG
jgi:hypothetical protein